MKTLTELLADPTVVGEVERAWDDVTRRFEQAAAHKPRRFMEREELSFHDYVKLLGYLAVGLRGTPGDILEIGVWKGKSLAFMRTLAGAGTRVIGIDPCALPGQAEELAYFQQAVYPDCAVVQRFSQEGVEDVVRLSRTLKLVHIDGGHERHHVWTDFLLYERFVVPGGYIVFDDYVDPEWSPDVKPAVDALHAGGFFDGYDVIGLVPGFECGFVIRKRPA
jgi:SAM-dependent methyltransferase